MKQRQPGIITIWQPARGRHRSTMVEGRGHGVARSRRSPWLPALAASGERVVAPSLARSL
jgi:hypothetical protein